MFRDTAQQAAVCRALLALAGLPAVELWTDQGPTDPALRLLVGGEGSLTEERRVLLRLAFDLWSLRGEARFADAFEHLDGEALRAVGELIVALGTGPEAVGVWLRGRGTPEIHDA